MSIPSKMPSEQHYRDILKAKIGQRPYNMWLANTSITINTDSVEIEAQTQLNHDWIQKRYSAPIEESTKNVFGKDIGITYSLSKEQKQEIKI